MKKAGMKMGVMMNTALDDTTSHMAELMIKGSSMGITQMTKVLNDYQPPRKEVTELANRLITAEQNNIDRLKAYL